MNSELMCRYIELDTPFIASGHPKFYNTSNDPFDWMKLSSMRGKKNLFEKRVAEFQKDGVMVQSAGFSLDGDF